MPLLLSLTLSGRSRALRAIDAEVIPTRPERKDGAMRGKTENLSGMGLEIIE
jgi:hypothetical protein